MLNYDSTELFRMNDSGVLRIPSMIVPKRVRHTLTMAPLKSLAITQFSFPFSNILRVREALKLQVLPYTSAGDMELFPTVLQKSPRTSAGIAWFVPNNEINSMTKPMAQVDNLVWPAPLALVSRINGNGATVWIDEDSICSMLWKDGTPILYRWKQRAKTSPEQERAWYENYCKAKSEELGGFFVLDASRPSELTQLQDIVRESLEQYHWLGDVNLSRSALDSALGLERLVHTGAKVAGWVFVLGLLALAGNSLRYYETRRNLGEVRGRSTALYKETFDPTNTSRIMDPLGLARSKIAELKGGGPTDGRVLNEVLTDLGGIFAEEPSMDVVIDYARYTAEGVDYTGSAPDVNTVQNFQKAWQSRASSAAVGNIQNAPGIGFRFDLSVKW